jgi:hypothetical protein
MTDNLPTDPLTGLVYQDLIALRWMLLESPPSAIGRASREHRNTEVLRIIATLDGFADEHPDISPELAHLDFKLNLVLDLVGEIANYYQDVPAGVPARLGAQAIEWESEQAPPAGGQVFIEIYLHHNYPHPVVLPGKVKAVSPLAQGFRSLVVFEPLNEQAQEWLEKIIFLHHRRQIAYSRRKA